MKLLTTKQKEFYKENGFIKVENVFTKKELDEISQEYDNLFEVKNI